MNPKRPDAMRAAVIDRFGGVDELSIRTIPVPDVGEDEVLIQVQSAGVGAWDPAEREGAFVELAKQMHGQDPGFPYVLGSEGAGVVAQVGERVDRFQPGDVVYAPAFLNPKGGFYAEYAVVNANVVSRVPQGLSIEQAGAMSGDATTALRGLEDVLKIRSGETVLIFGAGGGVGHFAVQLALRLGARVFAIASGEDGADLARRLGADAAIDGRKEDVAAAARSFAPNGLDAALLTAGGEAADRALSTLRAGGRAAYPNGIEPAPRAPTTVTIDSFDGDADRDILERLERRIASAPFDVQVARSFSLDEAADAHRALETHFLGKLVILPGSTFS